jgi:predicted  nucleic acid-binding Zn-ribbon protein
MSSLLSGLAQLQSVENRLRAAKAKLARCRRSVVLQENRIRSEQNTLEAKKEELQLTRMQCDRLELDLKGRDQQIAKLRAALNTAKTNKEYASFLTILNTSKADNSKLEIQILELMKAIEADEAECQKSREEIDAQKEKLELVRKEAEASAVSLEQEVASVQSEWDEAAAMITPDALEVFNRVAETYDGEAVVDVEEQEGRSSVYSCGGCFMSITNESVNLLMTRDEIIRCANCTRILVLKRNRQ